MAARRGGQKRDKKWKTGGTWRKEVVKKQPAKDHVPNIMLCLNRAYVYSEFLDHKILARFQGVPWRNMKHGWWMILPMLRCWCTLLPLQSMDGYDAALSQLEKLVAAPLEIGLHVMP
jgi:hypothetical protein